MFSLKRNNKGFTIIELLIVIVIIGILATIIIATYSSLQSKARNAKRQSDITAIQGQIELYYGSNNHYPTLANLNDSNWVSTNMKGFDQDAFSDPSNPTQSKTLLAAPAAKSYSYEVKDSDGASCESAAENCSQYVLTATYEGSVNNKTTFVKQNSQD